MSDYSERVNRHDITVKEPLITMELYERGLPKKAGVYLFRETAKGCFRPRLVTTALGICRVSLAIDEERWGGKLIFVKDTKPEQWLHIHA